MEKKIRTASLMDRMKQLLAHTDLTANGLATLLNLPTPTIHRLVTGEVQDPRISTLILIADYFGVSIDQLSGRQPLDAQFYSKGDAKSIKPAFSIPLLTMHEAHTLLKHSKESTQWFYWHSNSNHQDNNESVFAIAIKNNLYEPLFYHDSIIILDPKINPENGDYVLVNFDGDHLPVLKRYISEGKNKYLFTVNSDVKTARFDSKVSVIIGVVIEAYRSFRA